MMILHTKIVFANNCFIREIVDTESHTTFSNYGRFATQSKEQLASFLRAASDTYIKGVRFGAENKLEDFFRQTSYTEFFFRNPAYLILTGHFYLQEDYGKMAELLFTQAYSMDPVFGFSALYYRPSAYIHQSYALFKEKGERTNANNEFHAKSRCDYLNVKRIAEDLSNYIAGVQAATERNPKSQLNQQVIAKQSLFAQVQYSCDKKISFLARFDDPEEKNEEFKEGVAKIKPPHQSLGQYFLAYKKMQHEAQQEEKAKKAKDKGEEYQKNEFDNRSISIPWEEIYEMQNIGLKHFYELDIELPPPSWYTILALACIGILQVCVGVLLTYASCGLCSHMAYAFISG